MRLLCKANPHPHPHANPNPHPHANPNPNPTPTPKQVGEGHTTEDLLPLYQKLLSDEQDSVRVNALKSSAAICALIGSQQRREMLKVRHRGDIGLGEMLKVGRSRTRTRTLTQTLTLTLTLTLALTLTRARLVRPRCRLRGHVAALRARLRQGSPPRRPNLSLTPNP